MPRSRPPTIRSDVYGDACVRIALEAIAETSFPAKSLHLVGWPFDARHFADLQPAHRSAFDLSARSHDMLVSALGPNMTSLSLALRSRSTRDVLAQGNDLDDHPLGRILSACPDLKDLKLGHVRPPESFGSGRFTDDGISYGPFLSKWLANCKLETLELAAGTYRWQDLGSLFESHKSSLQRLSLSEVALGDTH